MKKNYYFTNKIILLIKLLFLGIVFSMEFKWNF